MSVKSEDFTWLYEVKFSEPRKQIGSCSFNGTSPKSLRAARMFTYQDRTCLYLMYEFTDDWGESYFDDQEGVSFLQMLDSAMAEAEEEFGVKREEWKKLTHD